MRGNVDRITAQSAVHDEREARLRAVFRVYEAAAAHLPALAGACQNRPGLTPDEVADGYLGPAVREFHDYGPQSADVRALCEDLVRRVRGHLSAGFSVSARLRPVLDAFAAAALDPPAGGADDLETYRAIGERLSRECYGRLDPHHPNLLRQSELRYAYSDRPAISCRPNKEGGVSTITVAMTAGNCSLDDYLNLPFSLMHEYVSHIHSGRTYAESWGSRGAFVEGWLLYAAEAAYRERLASGAADIGLSVPLARLESVERHAARLQAEARPRRLENRAYRLAKFLHRDLLDGDTFFWRLTLRFALADYDAADDRGIEDLHDELVLRLDGSRALDGFVAAVPAGKLSLVAAWSNLLAPADGPARFLGALAST